MADFTNEDFVALNREVRQLNSRILLFDERLGSMVATLEQHGAVMSPDVKASMLANIEANAKSANATIARLGEIEQQIASGRMQGIELKAQKSFGQMVIEHAGTKQLMADRRGSSGVISMGPEYRADVATVNSQIAPASGAAGNLVIPQHQPGIITPPLRRMTVRSRLMPGETSSNAIDYVKETGFQNNAAMVPEGTQKPQSDIKFERDTSPVRTMAHILFATKQIFDDAPQLQSYIDTRMRYGLSYTEEIQLLSGNGQQENLLGIVPQSTAFNDAYRVANDTPIDTIRRAKLQLRVAEYAPDTVFMNPVDWADIETQKDSQGRYIWANPAGVGDPLLWGLPVIETNAIAQGYFLAGAFGMAAQIFDREAPNVLISTEDGTNFQKNLVTMRAEERLALCVYRPQSFVYGPFVKAASS